MSIARIQPTVTAACVLSSTIKHHFGLTSLHLPTNHSAAFRRQRIKRNLTVSMSATSGPDPLEICVKASVTVPDKLGDCEWIMFSFFSFPFFPFVGSFGNGNWRVSFFQCFFRSFLSKGIAYFGGKESALWHEVCWFGEQTRMVSYFKPFDRVLFYNALKKLR